jgi:hypothetical protein
VKICNKKIQGEPIISYFHIWKVKMGEKFQIENKMAAKFSMASTEMYLFAQIFVVTPVCGPKNLIFAILKLKC